MPWSRHLAYQRTAETICRAALDDYVLQERIPMDRMRVRSLLGFEGVASYDIAAHISFDYSLRSRSLLACAVSGYP
jgi:hypothetical protein